MRDRSSLPLCRLAVMACLTLAFFSLTLSAAIAAPPSKPVSKQQTGLASYYGKGFHGLKTASGEIFNMYERVAAHPTLPLGSRVRITNLSNNRVVRLRITDRGPTKLYQHKGVVIDVSRGVAELLGFVKQGRIKVKIEPLNIALGVL